MVDDGITALDSITFAFTGADDNGVAGFECSLDGGTFTTCVSPTPFSGLAEGLHDFQVRAFDSSGIFDPTPDSFGWTVDLTPPDTNIIIAVDGNGEIVFDDEITGSNS